MQGDAQALGAQIAVYHVVAVGDRLLGAGNTIAVGLHLRVCDVAAVRGAGDATERLKKMCHAVPKWSPRMEHTHAGISCIFCAGVLLTRLWRPWDLYVCRSGF